MSNVELILGTAMWGWTVDQPNAWALLDTYHELGGVWVDTAVNYPINKSPDDFGRAQSILSGWLRENPRSNIKVLSKVGALENSGSSLNCLTKSHMLTATELLKGHFGDHLSAVSIHWDNRSDKHEVSETLEALNIISATGLHIGLSGIKEPKLYSQFLEAVPSTVIVQVKENIQTMDARLTYSKHFKNAHYWAYGSNLGGITFKDEVGGGESFTKRGINTDNVPVEQISALYREVEDGDLVTSVNDMFLIWNLGAPGLNGVILGSSKVDHLTRAFEISSNLSKNNDTVQLRTSWENIFKEVSL